MKAQHLPAILFVSILMLFTSCEPNAIDGDSNYWNSSTLIRLHLNGKVKTLTSSNGIQTDSYNQDGFITKSVYTSTDGTSTTTYNYASTGELTSTDFVSTIGEGASYSTNYEYGNTGKYVVQHPFHIMMSGLVPELKSSVNQWGRMDYVFNGNTMLLITTSVSDGITYKDTATVLYSGKYPTSLTTTGSFAKDMTYASNGMFLTYTEGFQGTGYYDERKYYFKPDNKFMLTDSVVHNSTNEYGSNHSATKYTYDSKKNVIKEESASGTYDYSYVYDSNDNWTSKTTKYKSAGSSTWGSPDTETRSIIYW